MDKKRTWIIAAVIIVLAGAGTATALALSGGGGDHTGLPTCKNVGDALPGKPQLREAMWVTHPDLSGTPLGRNRNLTPGYQEVRCVGDTTVVDIILFARGDMDPRLVNHYPDGAMHDGPWRAQQFYSRRAMGMTAVSPTLSVGSQTYASSDCDGLRLDRNAVIDVSTPNPSPPKVPADVARVCTPIVTVQAAKLVDSLG